MSDRYGNAAPPPSWAAVFGVVFFVLFVLALSADLWLPAYDRSQEWLDAPRPAAERMR